MDELEALVAQVPDEVLDYIEELEARVEQAQVTKGHDTDPDVDPIEKALSELPDEVAALVKSQRDRLEKAEQALEAQRIAKTTEEWVSKARSVDGLIDNPEEFGAQLREVAEINSDLADTMVKVLEAANERFAKADLFKELGKAPSLVAGSAEEQIEKAAQALREADPSLSAEAAKAEAWERNPDLYEQHVVEKRAQLKEV